LELKVLMKIFSRELDKAKKQSILEKEGIGRPSTYAPTIATIEARNYVVRDDNKKLMPTDIAFVVNDLLVKHFFRNCRL